MVGLLVDRLDSLDEWDTTEVAGNAGSNKDFYKSCSKRAAAEYVLP